MVEDLKGILHKNFKVKDLGDLKFFLGIEVMRSKEGIVLIQRKYALKLISEVGVAGAKPAKTPLEENKKITSTDFDEGADASEKDKELKDPGSYMRLIGRLLYLTNTRPEITYAVQHLNQFMHRPKRSHFEAAIRIVKYIKQSTGQ